MKMNNLKLILTLVLILLLSLAQNVFSQELDPEEDIFIRQLNENQFGAPLPGGFLNNQAAVMQIGSFNSGNITQHGVGNFQQENMGVIIQVGNNNESNLTQIGSGNQSLTQQFGNNNSSDLLIEGNFNSTFTLQQGNDNTFERTIMGNNQSFDLLQQGNGNTFSLGANALPGMKVTQQGNGMTIIIR